MSAEHDLRRCADRETRKIIAAAIDAGLRYRKTKSGLMFFAHHGEGRVTVHYTDSDHRARKNMIAQFRAIGFDPLEKRAP